jgi:SSS family solute:Na+ symporter
MNFSPGDYAIVVLYAIAILYIGFYIARRGESKSSSSVEFILAGRKLTLPFFVGSLVATWYGNILGVGEFVYSSGIVAWVCFAFPYYIAAVLFALFISKKIRENNFKTIPEQIESSYGKKAGWVASIVVLVITIPAAYLLMLGVMINIFTGWALWISIIIGAIVSIVYLYTGGFRADILTNAAQFVLMYVGFGALIVFAYLEFGSPLEILDSLPEQHLKMDGGLGWQYVVVWFIIAMQTFVDPTFHQRCAAAKTPSTARNGILISVALWMVFDALTLSAGLYAAANFQIENPLMAFPVLSEAIMPPIWKGIFVTALLATVMSTLDSYAFISAVTIGNDILYPLRNRIKRIRAYSEKSLTKFGLIITSIFGILMAIALPSAVDLIFKTASIAVPGLLMPLILSYNKNVRFTPNQAMAVLVSSSGISAIWTLGNYLNLDMFVSIEAMIPGILLSVILSMFFIYKNKENGFQS